MAASAYLFVPGHKTALLDKALAGKADAVIIDWEDAVQPADKPAARQATIDKLREQQAKQIWIRINAADSTEYTADCEALTKLGHFDGIMLAKAETADSLNKLWQRFAKPLLPLLESARGLANLADIATAEGVYALSFGALDFTGDLRFATEGSGATAYFDQLAFQLTLHSRLANLSAPIDSVYADFRDQEGWKQRCEHRLSQGFSGALCIHPAQIDVVQQVYGVHHEEQIAWAKEILAACAQHGEGAFQLNGKMVDKPVIERAKAILNLI
ncbi:CoA ester lyase [Cardiobacteriaceae bacterium TAE3-ERU3]|nr:CoA ester lyase [Cardiobacteriaceae bacterium TAE3-ERU3]